MSPALQAQTQFLTERLVAHLFLTVTAVLAGTVISVLTGLFVSRHKALQGPVLTAAGIIQTIPGLALLAIMVPLLGMIEKTPALIALILYSMLPILRNTVTGLTQIDADVVEAARGVGMTENQILFRVRLPLAAPIIIAGIRTATVWTVGMATLATPVGAVSLGNYIFEGLQTNNNLAITVGCIACSALAILLDSLIRLLEHAVAARRTATTLAASAVALLVVLAAYLPVITAALSRDEKPIIRIGCKTFTEQYILAELVKQSIERTHQYEPVVRSSLGSTVGFDALARNDIDLYIDYSGTLWAEILKRPTLGITAKAMVTALTHDLKHDYGINVLGPLGFENAYGLAMRRARARRLGVQTLSQLAAVSPQLTLGADMAFLARTEYENLVKNQGFRFRNVKSMEAVLMYDALVNGNVDVISAYTTEGKIKAYDLIILTDDIGAFPPYDALLLASGRVARTHPDLLNNLAFLTNAITNDMMLDANWSVDQEKQQPSQVAAQMLRRLVASHLPKPD